jgi:hypothetical protein
MAMVKLKIEDLQIHEITKGCICLSGMRLAVPEVGRPLH